jgi:hypothetical protein
MHQWVENARREMLQFSNSARCDVEVCGPYRKLMSKRQTDAQLHQSLISRCCGCSGGRNHRVPSGVDQCGGIYSHHIERIREVCRLREDFQEASLGDRKEP